VKKLYVQMLVKRYFLLSRRF